MKRALELQVAELQEYNEDLKRDAEVCRTNAEKNLEINQKLSEAISKLQADNTSLISEVHISIDWVIS